MVEAGWPGGEQIGIALWDGYGLDSAALVRFPVGQNTVNYRASVGGRDLFVKNYPVGSAVSSEVAAISLTQHAGQHGVPIASVVRSRLELTRFDGHGGCVGQAAWVAVVFS
jgi:hypothetical protein